MKKFFVVLSVLTFIGVMGGTTGVAIANENEKVTGCVRTKKDGDPKNNTTIKRVAVGDSPGTPCKSNDVEVTLPTDQVTDDLQSQVTANTTAIGNNDADISDLQADVAAIATVIGGSTGPNNLRNTDDTDFMGMFTGRRRDSENNIENRIPISGALSNFWARQTGPDPTTGDAERIFTVRLRTAPDPSVATSLTCTIGADQFVCADDVNCADVTANQRIIVEVDNDPNTGTLEEVQANWSAKFTPGAEC